MSVAFLEPGLEAAIALIRHLVRTSMWGVYNQVWSEGEVLLSDVRVTNLDYEPCLLIFIGEAFSRGVSASSYLPWRSNLRLGVNWT